MTILHDKNEKFAHFKKIHKYSVEIKTKHVHDVLGQLYIYCNML